MMRQLPNLLSLLRIVLAFFLFINIRNHQPIAACGIVFLGGLTDFLDGYLARRFHQVSALGGLLDPLADKIFFGSLFIALLLEKSLSIWVFSVFVFRDILLLLGTLFIKSKHIDYEFTPTFLSKLNTTLQFLFGMIALLCPDSVILWVLIGVISVTTILSGFLYFIRFANKVFG